MRKAILRKVPLKFVVPLLAMFVVVACSGTAERDEAPGADAYLAEKNLRIAEEVNQVVNFNIRGWQYVDRQNVILEDGPSRLFLVTLKAPCFALESAFGIGFTSSVNTITRSDSLVVRHGPGKPSICYINRLYRLEKIET